MTLSKPTPKLVLKEVTAMKVCDTEPIMKGSIIGKDVWRCQRCYNRIDKNDRYCRTCGVRLVDDRRDLIDE